MKKLIKSSFVLILFLSVSCKEDVGIIDLQETQDLPDNIESLTLISSDNEHLIVFLENSTMNKQELHLDEVSLLKFKGDEGKYAFTIPMEELGKQYSKTLMVYFKDSDFTKFKAIIHAVETSVDKNNIEHQVITISEYGKNSSVKIEYVDGRLVSSEKLEKNAVARAAGDGWFCYTPPFHKLDTDQSRTISKDEWESSSYPMYNSWNTLDFNMDDVLDLMEFGRVSCFDTCVSCNYDQLNCDWSDTLCSISIYAQCGYTCWY